VGLAIRLLRVFRTVVVRQRVGVWPRGGGAVGYGLTTVDTDVTPENALVNAWAYGPEGGGMAGYSLTTVATGVTPENALVYLNEVLIGIADDFDGKSDYLYLRPGRYRIEFRLSGYVSQGGEIGHRKRGEDPDRSQARARSQRQRGGTVPAAAGTAARQGVRS